jgi:hypothetical protein
MDVRLEICNVLQRHVLKAWSPGWLYWEVVKTLKSGA